MSSMEMVNTAGTGPARVLDSLNETDRARFDLQMAAYRAACALVIDQDVIHLIDFPGGAEETRRAAAEWERARDRWHAAFRVARAPRQPDRYFRA